MRKVLPMDATGLNALEDLHHKLTSKGRHLLLAGPHAQPLFAMGRKGLLDKLGEKNICADLDEALFRAKELLGQKAS